MIPVLSVTQMREIDETTIGKNLTLSYSFMLKAGFGVALAAQRMVGDDKCADIAILCGKGKNGGDGYVAGRLLLESGYKVMCYSLCDTDELKDESRIAFDEYVLRKGNFQVLDDIEDLSALSKCNLVIDAMLGTGLRGDPHGLCAQAIDLVNNSGVQVLAVDTPSGLNNDTGIPGNPCIKADVTVTMGFPKLGLYFYPGKSFVGELLIEDLGYPDEIVAQHRGPAFYTSASYLGKLMPSRHPDGSKYNHGVTLLICGSRGFSGSATLAAEATLRTGCGMTHLAVPESMLPVFAVKLTEPVLHPLPESNSGTLASSALDKIKDLLVKKDALCIGPGLTHEEQVSEIVRQMVKTTSIPIVLDADGLNAFKGRAEELKKHAGPLLCTPHKGEWQRIFGELPDMPSELLQSVKKIAVEYQMVILLKGSPTIVADPDGFIYVLPFGNSALAKAGTGDVLSGVITSLIAQGASLTNAAILGCYIHGETGTLLSEKYGEYSVIASDLVQNIYQTIRMLTTL